MPDAEGVIEARDVSDMPSEQATTKTKSIKGAENLDWGMRNRLSSLIKADGHCQFLPIDHGYFQGPTRCLERPGETIKDLLPYADGLFVTRGVLRACVDADVKTPIILRVSGGTSVVGANRTLNVACCPAPRKKLPLGKMVKPGFTSRPTRRSMAR